jgi:hypothetical protein
VEEIINHHLTDGLPLVISLPSTSSEVSKGTINHTCSSGNKLKIADKLLENIHKGTISPILITRPGIDIPQNVISHTHQSYIILLWSDEAEDLTSTLINQLDNMLLYDNFLNRRGKFLVVVTDFGMKFPDHIVMNITEILWKDYNIVNSLIMVPNAFQSDKSGDEYSFYFYTWFPYESGQCGTLKEVVLLERYHFGKHRCVYTNTSLFPSKIPLKINECQIRVSTWEVHPNVIITSRHRKQDGSVVYEYRGAEIEYLLLLGEAMNMTIEFLPPPARKLYLVDFYVHALTAVDSGVADVAIGSIPLNARTIAFCDPTISFIYTAHKWYVPCARPIRKIDSIINIFTLSTWLALILVLVLSSLSFWGIANGPRSSLVQESTVYKSLSESFNNAWAVFVGVSVAQMPRSFRLRSFFFLFVCYCFAINTVFQAFFTSYLIEPRFDKQIGTFDELNRSGITYLKHRSLDKLAFYIDYHQHEKLKIPQEYCANYTECMSRYLEGKDVTMMVTDIWAEYVAFSAGSGKKSLCTIDENVFTMGISMFVRKGHPLLERFNILIQHCLEAGLGEKYWSELTWNGSLHKSDESDSNGSSAYFAFTVFHLRVAFCLLAFGGALSCVAFIAEFLIKRRFTRSHCLGRILWKRAKSQ